MKIREVVFDEFSKSDQYGMIFTYLWAFDNQSDWDYIRQVTELFESRGAEVYCVELIASQETRLLRNETDNRLKNKPSKRDLLRSRQRLLDDDRTYRCVSYEGEVPFENYLRIDNTDIKAVEAARMIKDSFGL